MEFIESLESPEEYQSIEKLTEAHLKLRTKLNLSHEIIKKLNDKSEECQQLITELETAKDNIEKISAMHTSCLSKIARLEHDNENHRQEVEHHTKIISEQEIKIAADVQHVQQLICKLQQLKHNENVLEKSYREKVQTLETELKGAKEAHKVETKQWEMKLAKSIKNADMAENKSKKKAQMKISHDKGTSTDYELKTDIVRLQTAEKGTWTNEFYSIKDDPYPLFCSKCIIRIEPAPVDQILKQMKSCPTLITEVPSPRKVSEINELYNTNLGISSRTDVSESEGTSSDMNNLHPTLDCAERKSEVSKSDLQRLEQKTHSLERKLRKMKKEVQGKNPCYGFPCANHSYLGPYPNIFQPGAMMRTQPDLYQFQNWREGLKNKKRSRKLSMQKLNRHGIQLRKKRKLENGTSEWNIDTVSSAESIDPDHANLSVINEEPSNGPLTTESSQLNFYSPQNKVAKHCTENISGPPSRHKKREKLVTLSSTACSSSPRLHNDTNEENNSEIRNESSKVINETLSGIQIVQNDSRTLEYETINRVPKKRGRPPKCLLVTKIRNLKKNCNGIKSLVGKTASVTENNKNLSSGPALKAISAVNELEDSVASVQTIENHQITNNVDDYCPAKKYRVAHSVRKLENNCISGGSNDLLEVQRNDFQNEDAVNDMQSETTATIEKSDVCEKEINILGRMKNNSTIVRMERKIIPTKSVDSNLYSILVKTPELEKHLKVEPAEREIMTVKTNTEKIINASSDLVDETINVEKDIPFQPHAMIPKMFLNIQGVHDPCKVAPCIENNGTEEEEPITNLSLNIDNLSGKDASLRILRSNAKIIRSRHNSLSKNDDIAGSKIDKRSSPDNSEMISRTMRVELSRCGGNIHPLKSLDNEILNIDNSPVSVKSDESEDVHEEIFKTDKPATIVPVRKCKRRMSIESSPVRPIRELRSRCIMLNPSTNLGEENVMTDKKNQELDNETSAIITELSGSVDIPFSQRCRPRALIQQLLNERTNSQEQNFRSKQNANPKLQGRKENQVQKELSRLIEDADWTKGVLLDVIERLSKFKTHTIAKCTIDFLVTKAMDNEELDQTHTPPAPLLTKTQQRILTMLVLLNRTIPNIIRLVQAGIEFRLFRLGHAPEVNVIETLARVFTALARINKDRERLRILCCDALYCLGLKAMPLIYVILSSWPEVFPMEGSSSEPLVLCFVDSIMTLTGDKKFPKFLALKKYLTGYYGYESSGYVSMDLARNFMTTLRKQRQNGLDTAIIILAKKKGPDWTYDNIIQDGLLQTIIQNTHPSIHDAFCLLGHLLRSFPIEDTTGMVRNILEQLCTLMESAKGSPQQQEGIASAILSLSRHSTVLVTKTILNWEPSEPLSETLSLQITALFDAFPPQWWREKLFGKKYKKISSQAKK